MPIQIQSAQPAGYAAEVNDENNRVQVIFREFTSSDDGHHFIQRLEGIPDTLIKALPTIKPSQVDHLLAVYSEDGTATVYCNELNLILNVRTAKSVKAGESVYVDDIADIAALAVSAEIPDDAPFLFLFSVGWRKGLFYDFGVSSATGESTRPYTLSRMLGALYRQVMFQERYSISDADWQAIIEHKWFPFIGLGNELITDLLSRVKQGKDPDTLLDRIVDRVRELTPSILEKWVRDSRFDEHHPILERAIEHFNANDDLSCISLLFPRIEGLLRTLRQAVSTTTSVSQKELAKLPVIASAGDTGSLLMPHRFETYLNDVYFASFDPAADNIDLSRNSVSHGVANATSFNRKSSAIGLLILDQLSYFLATHDVGQLDVLSPEPTAINS